MATRGERARDEDQRRSAARKRADSAKRGKVARKPARKAGRVAAKATYAYEAPRPGKPSRKSTRKSANRAKADASFNQRESLQRGSPEARARRARVQASRARGS